MTLHKPELLLPAGSLDRLKTAFLYGADAVYCGMPGVSLRNKTSFTIDDMKQGIAYAHSLGKKVYLTINLFLHNHDVNRLKTFTAHLKELNPDGAIIADPGVFQFVKETVPDLPLHISTQANVCSSMTAEFWKKQGASLVVLGRETPLSEIKEIRSDCPDLRLEMFIHGALCISYSGRCLLSNFLTGRSANKGNCAHACRWKYKVYLEEENRPDQLMQLDEDDHGAYVMNSRDLCLLPRLNEILPVGMDSFKIEGRNKSEYYVAVTAHAYRFAIDSWFTDPDHWTATPFMREIETLQSRGYTVGFLDGNAGPEAQNYTVSASTGKWRYTARIVKIKGSKILLEVKHKIQIGQTLQVVIPSQLEPLCLLVTTMTDGKTNQPLETISCGHVDQTIWVDVADDMLPLLQPGLVLRSLEKDTK